MIVVSTPTGKIGSQVIPHLLAANERVRVLVHDPSKLSSAIRERIEMVTGSLDDEAVMDKALERADSALLVVPPSFKDNNDETYYLRFTRPALKAIKRQGVKRVVGVSVLGPMTGGVVFSTVLASALSSRTLGHGLGNAARLTINCCFYAKSPVRIRTLSQHPPWSL